ncbi:MAG: flagellar biosynthesis protein FliQ [Chloroflexota bacterium]
MTEAMVIELGRGALLITLELAAPALGLALLVGLFVSVMQAATQINEATLSFVPKIFAVFLALVVFGPWMLTQLTTYTAGLLGNLASFAR